MIDLTYTISESEFIEAQTLWCPAAVKKLPGRVILNAAYLIFAGFLGWSIPHLAGWLQIALEGSLIGIVLIARWRRRSVARFQYFSTRDQFEDLHIRIDESGYSDEKPGRSGGWITWQGFTGWKEGSTVFVLGRTLQFITVPKAALSTEQQADLRALLTTHMRAT